MPERAPEPVPAAPLRPAIKESISAAIARFSNPDEDAPALPGCYRFLLVDEFQEHPIIPAGEWHEQMRLTGRSYLIPEDQAEDVVRHLSQGLPEPTIRDRLRKTRGDIRYQTRQGQPTGLNDSVLHILEAAVVEACPETQRMKGEQLHQRRILVATVAFLICYRLRLDGDGRCFLTYNAIKHALDWQGTNGELFDQVMTFVYRIIDKCDRKLFKREFGQQRRGMTVFLENEFARNIIDAMPALVEHEPQIGDGDVVIEVLPEFELPEERAAADAAAACRIHRWLIRKAA